MSDSDFSDSELSSNFNANSKYPFLRDLKVDQDVSNRLTIQLDNVVRGNSDVYISPIGKDNDPHLILSAWDEILESNRHKLNDELYNLEQSNRSKFGPRSIAKPWNDRLDDVSAYFKPDSNTIPQRYLLPERSSSLKVGLRPLSLNNAARYLKTNTSAGLPYLKKKALVRDRTIEKFNILLERKDPCVLFTRTQEAMKTRTVWGFPIVDTLNEMMFYQPLLDHQKRLDWRSALRGPTFVDANISKLIDSAIDRGLQIISVDFSQYDASVGVSLQKASFDYIKALFQDNFNKQIDYISERFGTIGLLTPNGVKFSQHGVPSGSTFTNEVDSIAQYLVAKSSATIIDGLFQIQGDDGVYAINVSDLLEFKESFKSAGLKLNDDKSYQSSDSCIYLQCLHHPDYREDGLIRGIYPTYRALNRILYQERWSSFEDFDLSGRDYYSLRTICILENCKYHPLFEDLVKLVKGYDKYSLSVTRGSVSKFVDLVSNGQGSGGLLNNQYGDDVKGIKSFRTWRLINS